MSVAIIGDESGFSRALADALTKRDQPVAVVSPETCDVASAEAIESALNAATKTLGETPALVRLAVSDSQRTPGELASIGLDEWVARTETPLLESLAFHQAAQRFLADRRGRIIVVIPTVGLSGGQSFVPLTTTVDADRALVKAQARISGKQGLTLNCVAVPSAMFVGAEPGSANDPDRGGLAPPAFEPPTIDAIAGVIVSLLDPAFDVVTGQTLAVDGGTWMTP